MSHRDAAIELEAWPELSYASWQDTCSTLHLWTQMAGKVRLVQTPWLNHSWHVPLYVTSRGLTTSPIPHGQRTFELNFDFVDHELRIETSLGGVRTLKLEPRPIADVYAELMARLRELGFAVEIDDLPSELPDPIRFREDRVHASYDPAAVERFVRVLSQADRVFKQFRTGFLGKVSPVHFFWGSFDLAVTRFSGGTAPRHPGGIPHLPQRVAEEAYSHEVSSAGFWPGGRGFDASFYSYAYPEPPGFRAARVQPDEARFDPQLGELVLPYAAVRAHADPDAVLLSFLQTSYEAAADAGGWDRAALECGLGRPGVPRALP